MHILRHSSLVVALGLLLGALAASARAQENQQTAPQDQQAQGPQNQGQTPQGQQNEEQPTAPIPAYHSPLASAAGDDTDEETQPLAPDTRPLSGAQNLSLGSLENNHSYWQPHVDISGSVDSNPEQTPNGSGWGTWTSFSGGVDVHRISGNSDMTLNYLGGAAISTDGSANNGIVQLLGFVDRFTLRRWTVSFIDQVGYLPGSSYGFGGLGGIETSTGGSVGLGTAFGPPDQTALTGNGQSFTNAFSTEADMHLTPRSSLTFIGGYSLLHYFDSASDLLNSTDASFRGGYNYLLTRKDTIAVFYTYTAYRYSNFNQSINDHTIQASYARRVTGRLAFQIAAGPGIALSRIPITAASGSSGSETGSGTSTNSSTQLYWSLNMNLQYQLQRTGLGLSYSHGVSAGSGVLGGSLADIVTGSVTRPMSRTFSSGLTAGYSRNHGLAINSTTPAGQTYDYWFAGANFSHPIGRTLGLNFSYQMQYQSSDSSFCIGPTCGTSVIRHLISFGVGWHEKPLLF
jgi:hypothetical protein